MRATPASLCRVPGHVSACVRCGTEIRWVTVEGEGRIPLDSISTFNGPYVLNPDDVNLARRVDRPGRYGYENHDETCPKLRR